ncbi:unnamed protein product [marine sediment metagenome]|uniref:Uncharacterized protein n=1 Tax=marine sediment metagenome TaxID=412755 RepID=X1JC61_9ZZZZ
MEAEPLKIDSPTDTDLTWGVVQKVARPDRINVRCVAIVDTLVDVNNRLAKDVTDAMNQPWPIRELDVTGLTSRKERRQGVIPHSNRAQRFAPSDLNLVVIDKRLEAVESFFARIVGDIQQVKVDV